MRNIHKCISGINLILSLFVLFEERQDPKEHDQGIQWDLDKKNTLTISQRNCDQTSFEGPAVNDECDLPPKHYIPRYHKKKKKINKFRKNGAKSLFIVAWKVDGGLEIPNGITKNS